MTVRLREMSEGDLAGVLAIERASFASPWSENIFREEVARTTSDRFWLVAARGDDIVGYAGILRVADEAHVLNLAVHPLWRRRGIATALLVRLLEEAVALGARRATLEVRSGNYAALGLYRELGFEKTAKRKGYYDDTGEDAVIMWAEGLSEETPTPGDVRARADAALEADGPETGSLILAIETSCDETAAAVLRDGRDVLSDVVASQVDFHARFGGVVPEIASRKHIEAIVGVVDEALERAGVELPDLTAIAVTYGPGLVGALVVGLSYAKGLAYGAGLPLIGVNHLEGHIVANVLAQESLAPPLVALVVSGGHTSLVYVPRWGEYHTLGQTLDDAAGEAFDKVAKVLGLGYPGGPAISRMAVEGDPDAIEFPRAMIDSGDFAFSLSGLKTAVITYVRREEEAGREVSVPDVAASFQRAVIDVQVAKTLAAAKDTGSHTVCLAGGVAANPELRERLRDTLEAEDIKLVVPEFRLCTDNAVMIAAAAHFRLVEGPFLTLDAEAVPDLALS